MKYLILLASFIVFFGCSTPQKAINWGMVASNVYEKVNTEALSIRDELPQEQKIVLADTAIRAGKILSLYNLTAMAWELLDKKPDDFDETKQALQETLFSLIDIIKEFRYAGSNN